MHETCFIIIHDPGMGSGRNRTGDFFLLADECSTTELPLLPKTYDNDYHHSNNIDYLQLSAPLKEHKAPNRYPSLKLMPGTNPNKRFHLFMCFFPNKLLEQNGRYYFKVCYYPKPNSETIFVKMISNHGI